jgi:hypothetical protein
MVVVRRMTVTGSTNMGTRTQEAAMSILATGSHSILGATHSYGITLVMTGAGLMVAMHGVGNGNNILGTGTPDQELIPIGQDRRSNLSSHNVMQATRLQLSAQSTPQIRQESSHNKLVKMHSMNRLFQRFSSLKRRAKIKSTKDHRVKVVSLFASDAINLDMESLNAKQSYSVIFVQARNI